MEKTLQRQLRELKAIVESETNIDFNSADISPSVIQQMPTIIALAQKFGLEDAAVWLSWR
jgi:hypothetical protein